MVIAIKGYVSDPLDVFHEVLTIPLLGALQGCKYYCFFSMKVFAAKDIHHVIPCGDGSWL